MSWEITAGLGYMTVIWIMIMLGREGDSVLSQFMYLVAVWAATSFMNFAVSLANSAAASASVVTAVTGGYTLSLYIAWAYTAIVAMYIVWDILKKRRGG